MADETVGTMKDKIAITTGAGRGLGRNTAVHLARRGVDVIVIGHSNKNNGISLGNGGR